MRKYQANREVVVAGLAVMGVQSHEYAPPQGAFYMYVDLSAHGVTDSLAMCGALLEEAGVAMTPGVDFEDEGCGLGERRHTPLPRPTTPYPASSRNHVRPPTALPLARCTPPTALPLARYTALPGERRVRISFPGTTEHVTEAMRRLQQWWQSEQGQRWHT